MKHLGLVGMLFLLSACTRSPKAPSKEFWLDNPTDNAIQVKIDSAIYDVPANSGRVVDLLAGRHSLEYGKESVRFFVKPNDQGVVINPTLSNYVFFNEIYGEIGKEEQASAEFEKIKKAYLYPFELQSGATIHVPFKVISDQLFIEQYEYYWHLGITQPYPDSVRIARGSSNLATAPQSKLFREKDFFNYVGRENMPDGFSFKSNQLKLSELEPFVFAAETVTIDCEQAQERLQAYRADFVNLVNSDAEDYKANHDKLRHSGGFPMEVEKECSPRYNQARAGDENGIDSATVRIGKNLEELGRMNAFIIKQ